MFNLFCCKRRNLKIPKTQNEIKLELNLNNNKDSQPIEVNQSQSLSILSNISLRFYIQIWILFLISNTIYINKIII